MKKIIVLNILVLALFFSGCESNHESILPSANNVQETTNKTENTKVSEDINHILAKWDPIRVGENIATDEYKGYIPMILHLLPNRQELMEYLENVLMNEMGLDYNSNNKNHLYDLQKICNSLIEIYQNHKK